MYSGFALMATNVLLNILSVIEPIDYKNLLFLVNIQTMVTKTSLAQDFCFLILF